MAEIMMIVDTAVITPVNRMPLIDDTDFKTIEAAVAYNAAGMDLRWNFVTAAGVQTSTAVTPTTAGSYDWTHLGDGIYSMEIPATGGASANNDTEGFGWWSGVVTGVLPFCGPIIQFSPANVVNSLVTGTDILDVSVTQWLGTAAATPTVAGVPEVDITHVAGATTDVSALATNVAAILVDTGTTLDGRIPAALVGGKMDSVVPDTQKVDLNTIKTQTVATTGAGTITVPAAATLASTTNITAGTITTTSNLTTNNDKTGYSLTATTGLGNQTANITGNLSGSVGSVTGAVGSVTGAVGSVTGAVGSVTANVNAVLANTAHGGAAATAQFGGVGGITSTLTGNVTGSVGSVTGNVGGNVAGSTNSVTTAVTLPTIPTNWITADGIAADAIGSSELAATAANEIADAILDRNVAGGSSAGRLVKEALYVLRNKTAIAGGTLTVYGTDDTTSAFTAAVTTAAGNPVSAIDPA